MQLAKPAVILAIGAGAGPLVQLLATPILARLFTPAQFGAFAVFISAASVLVSVSCLRFESAIPVVEDDQVNATMWLAIGSLVVLLLVLLTLVGSGAIYTLYPPFADLGQKIWALPVAVTCGGCILMGCYWSLRSGRYLLNAGFRSSQVLFYVLIAISASWLGLISAYVMGGILAGLAVLYIMRGAMKPIPLGSLYKVAAKLKQYPTLLAPASLLDTFALALPVFFINSNYGADATGHYSQIQRLVGSPLLLAGLVAGQLFIKKSGELFRAGHSSRNLLWIVVSLLASSSVLLLVFLALFGEPLCELLLGKAWRVDSEFLLLVALPLVARCTVSPVSSIFLTHHRIIGLVRWQALYCTTLSGVLYLASMKLDFEQFLLAFAVHEIALYAIYLTFANRVATTAHTEPCRKVESQLSL